MEMVAVSIEETLEAGDWSNVWMVEAFNTSWGGRSPDEALAVVYKPDSVWNESFYKTGKLTD